MWDQILLDAVYNIKMNEVLWKHSINQTIKLCRKKAIHKILLASKLISSDLNYHDEIFWDRFGGRRHNY